MSTNRSNNRRRGRGNNRGPVGGGQGNRIDSRARGNAPQMLEKYKKLAHDASLNDDRVQTEYYLQFADHYFRILADSRTQKDEQRARRDNERDYGDGETSEEEGAPYERAADRVSGGGREDRAQGQRSRSRQEAAEGEDEAEQGASADEAEQAPESDNPFVRDTRARPSKPRGRRQAGPAKEGSGLDPDSLPPSISLGVEGDEGAQDDTPAAESAPAKPARATRTAKPRAPRARTRASRPAEDGDAEALEAVS